MDEYIFILSAMRSGSTLLQHIVGQRPEVLSAGETKIEYHSREDFEQLKRHLLDYNGVKERADYIYLEKCVHRRYFPQPVQVDGIRIKYLFITRNPVPAMSSLLEQEGWPYAENTSSAAWYYDDRLKALVELAQKLDRKAAAFVTYEELVADPDPHLARLTRFLGMERPLVNRYPKQRWTAKISLGDVSDNIKASTILPAKRKNLVQLPGEMEASLKSLHKWTNECLADLCKGA
jgi:LPS sulfotransferase NodH